MSDLFTVRDYAAVTQKGEVVETLFNGVDSASQCERPLDDTKTAKVPTSEWLKDVNDMDVNTEARVESNWQITAPDGASSQIVIQIAGN